MTHPFPTPRSSDLSRRNKVVGFETIADLELLQGENNVEAQLHAREALRQVETIVDSLPTQCRRVFILRRIHEKSMLEIAEEMSLSVSTVEKDRKSTRLNSSH